MSERIRIDADTAEKLALRIKNYACEVRDETNKFVMYYNQNSDYWRDSKAQLFQQQMMNIFHHSTKATEVFYEYGDQLHNKVKKLRS